MKEIPTLDRHTMTAGRICTVAYDDGFEYQGVIVQNTYDEADREFDSDWITVLYRDDNGFHSANVSPDQITALGPDVEL